MRTPRAPWALVLVLIAGIAAACGAGDAVNAAVVDVPFALTLATGAPGGLTVVFDGKASTSLEVTGAGGRPVQLTAEDVPFGLKVFFAPDETLASSTVTVTTSTKALLGRTRIVLRAREGSRTASTVLDVAVIPAKASLSLSVTPTKATVRPESAIAIGVNVVRSFGFAAPVEVKIDALPAGLTAAPVSIAAGATSGVLTISASAQAPVGTSAELRITARGGNLVATAAFALAIVPRPGDLDLSFGTAGMASRAGFATTHANNLLVRSTGNVLVTAYAVPTPPDQPLSILQLLPSGAPDLSFGASGVAEVFTPGRSGAVADETVEIPLQKFVIAGSSLGEGANLVTFWGMLKNGGAFTAFGTNGVMVWPGAPGRARSIVSTGGSLIAIAPPADADPAAHLFRFSTIGVPDVTFGTGGMKAMAGLPYFFPARLMLDQQAKVLVLGSMLDNFVLLRLDANGDLDSTFGTAGRLEIDFGRADLAAAIALQQDGKLVVAGTAGQYQPGRGCAVARIEADGHLDATFGNGGKALAGTASLAECYGVTVQTDGKILAFGKMGWPDESPTVFRFDANGVLDATFRGGKTTASFGAKSEWFSAGLVLPTGRLLVMGETSDPMAAIGFAAFWL